MLEQLGPARRTSGYPVQARNAHSNKVMAKTSDSRGGRPPFKPTARDRKHVEMMVGFGIPEVDIAKCLGISAPTLRKHFRDEIDTGSTKAIAKVGTALFQKAIKGDTSCMIFFLKTRGGWREKQQVEHSGSVQTPIDGLFAAILRSRSGEPKPDVEETTDEAQSD
jgi:hypothetical protein